MLEQAADALGPLCKEVVFLGGASIALWLTDPSAPNPRPTKDVDVVVEVTSRLGYLRFSEKMRSRGFSEDAQSTVLCRWRHTRAELLLDAMPANPAILGFANLWQAAALEHAIKRELPSGAIIRAATAPYLLATKLEAFAGRGRNDVIASHDFEDIIALIDGRAELPEETHAAPMDLRVYLATQLNELRAIPDFLINVATMLRPDPASQARAETVVLPRIARIATSA
ncbi:MAG TPA: hypothetical protein VGX16_05890 [Solirubrobacteraceae bacterium]|jgi:hypothetical protein|nr:hypothetical protein [Solirubrobacteraceae bacterium]